MNHRNGKRILLADNSADYRHSVLGFLGLEGYVVLEAGTPEEALELLETKRFDLVLADLRMRDELDPNDVGGMEIAKFASECGIPCIIVTAYPTVELARMALRSVSAESYAKDMITKTSGPQALLDSIRQVLRPASPRLAGDPTTQAPPPKDTSKTDGVPVFDPKRGLVLKKGQPLNLSKFQYRLLAELFKADGGVCSYADLIQAVYGEQVSEGEARSDRRLRNLVERTKANVEDAGSGHDYIEAVPGRGFRLNLEP